MNARLVILALSILLFANENGFAQCTTDVVGPGAGYTNACGYTNHPAGIAYYDLTVYQSGWSVTWSVIGGQIVSGQGTSRVGVKWLCNTQPQCFAKINVIVNNGQGCTFDLSSIYGNYGRTIIVGPAVTPHYIYGEDTICAGTKYRRYITQVGCLTPFSTTYWGDSRQTFPAASETCDSLPPGYNGGASTYTTYFTNPGTYQIINLAIYNNCNCAAADTFDVVVLPSPNAGTQISGPTTVCLADTHSFTINSTPGSYNNWIVVGGQVVSGQGSNTALITPTGSGTMTVNCRVTDGDCQDYFSFPTTINSVTITAPPSLCPGDSAWVYCTSLPGYVEGWTVTGGQFLSANGMDSILVQAGTGSSLNIQVSSSVPNCTTSASTSLGVFSIPAPSFVISGNPTVCYPCSLNAVTWQPASAVQATGNTMTFNGIGCSSATQQVGSSSYARAHITETNNIKVFALTNPATTGCNYNSALFSIYLGSNGQLVVRESGVNMTAYFPYSIGDSVTIGVFGSTIKYYHNTTLLYTSQTAPSLPLRLTAYAPSYSTGTLANVTVGSFAEVTSAPYLPPLWSNLQWFHNGTAYPYTGPAFTLQWPISTGDSVRLQFNDPCTNQTSYSNTYYINVVNFQPSPVTVLLRQGASCEGDKFQPIWDRASGLSITGNTLTKTSSNGLIAGIYAVQKLRSGYRLEAKAIETNRRRMMGLSVRDVDFTWQGIKYGIMLYENGTVQIRESGSANLIGPMTYQAGDVFAIERSGQQIRYLRNGVLFYTSTVPATGDLHPDFHFDSQGGTLADVWIKRGYGNTQGPVRQFDANIPIGHHTTVGWMLNGKVLPYQGDTLTLGGLMHTDSIACFDAPPVGTYPNIAGGLPFVLNLTQSSLPNPFILPSTICRGDSSLLALQAGYLSAVWPSSPDVLAVSNDSAFFFPLTTTSYTVVVVDSTGCEYDFHFTQEVLPVAGQIMSIKVSDSVICSTGGPQSVEWMSTTGWSQTPQGYVSVSSACATSALPFRKNHYARIVVGQTNVAASFGLVNGINSCGTTLGHEFYMNAGGTMNIREGGSNVGSSFTYAIGDVLEFRHYGDTLKYFKNGVMLRKTAMAASSWWNISAKTWTAGVNMPSYSRGVFVDVQAVTNPLFLNQGFHWDLNGLATLPNVGSFTLYDTISNLDSVSLMLDGCFSGVDKLADKVIFQVGDTTMLRIALATDSTINCSPRFFLPQYNNLAGVSTSGSTVTQTVNSSTWGNAAFGSLQTLGDGYGVMCVAQVPVNTVSFGMSTTNLNGNWISAEYSFLIKTGNILEIRELGSGNLLAGGSYANGDTLRILYEAGQVKYYKNNTLLRTTSTGFGKRFMMDCALTGLGSQLTGLHFFSLQGQGLASPMNLVATSSPLGTTGAYKWFYNGSLVANSLSSYSLPSIMPGDSVEVVYSPNGSCEFGGKAKYEFLPAFQMAVPSISATSTTACMGDTIVLSTTAGPSGILWSNGATSQAIAVTTSGIFSVAADAGSGCSVSSSIITVVFNPTPAQPAITASGPTTFCQGNAVTLLTSAGPSGLLWSNGATTQTVTVSSGGTYSVTETNSSGCSSQSSVITITVSPSPPTPSITTSGPTSFCQGDSVILTTTAGPSGLTWTTGDTTQSIVVTTAGNHSVTETNSFGCSETSPSILVNLLTSPAQPLITASGPTALCQGDSVTLSTTAGPAGIQWSTGDTTQSITVSNAGTFSITETNGLGCSATSLATTVTFSPNPPPQPTITSSGPTSFCQGDSVILTTTAGPSGLTWTTGDTTQSIVVTTAGNHSVTETNSFGCSETSPSILVNLLTSPAQPPISASGPTALCQGDSVTLSTTAGPAGIQWSTGDTTQSITVFNGGTFSVTETNGLGCSATSLATTVTLSPSPPTPSITASGPTSFCQGDSVILTTTAGPSGISWSTGATTQSIIVTASGIYDVVETNTAGCQAYSQAINVTVNQITPPTITPSGPTAICQGDSITLSTTSGPSGLQWSTGDTTQSITVSAAGNYSLTETSGFGCLATSSITTVTVIPAPPIPTITAIGPTTFCQGNSVALMTSSGPSNILWSNGATTQAITVAASGTYSVTETNSSGCESQSAGVVVTVNPNPNPPVITFDGQNLNITPLPGATYQWYLNGFYIPGTNITTYTPTIDGNYTVTVTDSNGCSSTSQPHAFVVIGISTPEDFSIILIPNPTDGKFKAIVQGLDENLQAKMEVWDNAGRKVLEFEGIEGEKDLGMLPKGMYHVVISWDEGIWRGSLILQ